MEEKRTVTVDLMGQRLTVRTTEPEETLRRSIDRINRVLEELRTGTDTVDTVRLFALGLLHLGREIDMLETKYMDLQDEVTDAVTSWTERVRQSLG